MTRRVYSPAKSRLRVIGIMLGCKFSVYLLPVGFDIRLVMVMLFQSRLESEAPASEFVPPIDTVKVVLSLAS